jgi:two-component system cell cycle response regulator
MTDTEKMNVLFVGNGDENLLALEELLKNPELNFVKSEPGNAALTLTLEHDFALVLLDVQTHDMPGLATAELMRSHAETKHVPIIVIAAFDQDQKFIFRGYEAGAVDYLFKPLEPYILNNKVKIFLDSYKQRKALRKANKQLYQANLKIQKQQKGARDEERLKEFMQKAGVLCHELNQPLQSISGYTDLLLMDLDKDNPVYERMHRIRLQVDKMAHISRKLMNITRYETQGYLEGKIIEIDKACRHSEEDDLSKLVSETGS